MSEPDAFPSAAFSTTFTCSGDILESIRWQLITAGDLVRRRLAVALAQIRTAQSLSDAPAAVVWSQPPFDPPDVDVRAFTSQLWPKVKGSLVRHDRGKLYFSEGWRRELQRLSDLTRLPDNWDGHGGKQVSSALQRRVIDALAPFNDIAPAPSFSTGGGGDVWALWAGYGLDIEVRFDIQDEVYSMIDDARGVIEPFEDEDPSLRIVEQAIIEFGNRAYSAAVRKSKSRFGYGSTYAGFYNVIQTTYRWPAETGTVGDYAPGLAAG